MRHFALTVLVLAMPAFAQSTFSKLKDDAYARARTLSQKGDYAAAASVLEALLATSKDGEDYERASLRRGQEIYTARAGLADKAKTDAKSARALIVDLLVANAPMDAMKSDEPRVAVLLAELKKVDPKAKTFFDGRSVKVTVAPSPLSATEADALVASVVGPLRDLGFAAGVEGTDEVVLTVTRGNLIPAPMMGDKGISCELKIDATWLASGKKLMAVDLSRRGGGWSDLADRCYAERIKDVRTIAAARFFTGWDAR
jgi:hypothetical protein